MYLASVILQNLILGTQILIVAVSLYFVFSSSRTVHVAVGAIGTFAAYALYFGMVSRWPLTASAGLALLAALVLGLGSAKLLEPFAIRKEPLMGLIVSLALVLVLEALISMLFGTDGKNLAHGVLPVIDIGGIYVDLPGAITIILGVFLAIVSWIVINFTDTGRLFRGVAESPELSTSLGINNRIIHFVAHCAAALVAGVVVILVGWHTALTPLMGFNFVISAYMAMLIGGYDLRGIAVASYAIGVIPGIAISFSDNLSEDWRLVIVFLVAAVVLIFRPGGIFAKKLREA